jgi:hypothetical protein
MRQDMIVSSSAVQLVLDSPNQLTIIRPINMGLVIGASMSGVGGSLFLLIIASFMKSNRFITITEGASFTKYILVVFFALCGVFVGYWAYTDAATAVLSKTQGTLSITHDGVTDTYPLQSVQQAQIQSADGGTLRMIFVLSDGQIVPMGRWAEREGMYQAANAVNSFLSGTMGSTSTTPSTSVPQVPDWEKEMQRKYDLQVKEYQERLRKETAGKE